MVSLRRQVAADVLIERVLVPVSDSNRRSAGVFELRARTRTEKRTTYGSDRRRRIRKKRERISVREVRVYSGPEGGREGGRAVGWQRDRER